MSFIGNRPDSFGYSTTSYDHFNGTGSQTVYTLSRSVTANADIFVTVNNVPQDPGVAYYVSNLNTLTFTSAPSASYSGNIVVVYRNFVQSGVAPGANTVTSSSISPGVIQPYHISSLDLASGNGTGAIKVPVGTSAQRPTATSGYIRYNTDLNTLESANGTAWANVGSGSSSSSSSAANVTSLTGNVYISSAGGVIDASNATIGFIFPSGTYNQRPTSTANGTTRWNTSNTQLEVYVGGGVWQGIAYSIYPVQTLVVAGGGGSYAMAAGGAGGLVYASTSVIPGTSYSVVVGAGSTGGFTGGTGNYNGNNSSFAGLTAIGGGGGVNTSTRAGSPGGSGSGTLYGPGGSGGAGTSGQGNPGGVGNDGVSSHTSGGGGGGAGGTGGNATGPAGASTGGAGGAGLAYSLSGSSVYYAGGGGGSDDTTPSGASGPGGIGGGGPGSPGVGGSGTPGSANRGGGGGGGNAGAGSGGSGIVIITYLGNQRGTGGTVTSSGGYTIHTFTTSGTFIA